MRLCWNSLLTGVIHFMFLRLIDLQDSYLKDQDESNLVRALILDMTGLGADLRRGQQLRLFGVQDWDLNRDASDSDSNNLCRSISTLKN